MNWREPQNAPVRSIGIIILIQMGGAEAQKTAMDLLLDLEKVMSGVELRSCLSLMLPRGAAGASGRCCGARAPAPGSAPLVFSCLDRQTARWAAE